MLVYSYCGKEYANQIDQFVSLLSKARNLTNIRISEPAFCEVHKPQLGIEEWKRVISNHFEDDKIILVVLNDSVAKELRLYGELKAFITNQLKAVSQFVLSRNMKSRN